jgi:RsiW-degrading membrane proteinase PrsW (M82 family)
MRYFYQDRTGQRVGPYSREELRQLHLNGIVTQETVVWPEGAESGIPFRDVWSEWQAPQSATSRKPGRTSEDLRALAPHLLLPLKEVQGFNWLKNRKLIMIAAVGLAPLFVLAMSRHIHTAFWAMAIYFSVLWALFFYHVFPTPGIRVSTSLLCFFTTGVLSVSVLLIAYALPPLSWIVQDIEARSPLNRLMAYVLAVGLPEELCKALTLFALLKRTDPLPPQSMVFYGLMSGLGFGIYEGVDYQMGRNFRYASGEAEYYLLNLARVTTLPFLHAMWTGIAGYFIGFAGLYPRRQRGLILIAVGLPAVLHGLYNTFNQSIIGLGFALLTVLALNLYLARSVEFEEALIEKNLSEMP